MPACLLRHEREDSCRERNMSHTRVYACDHAAVRSSLIQSLVEQTHTFYAFYKSVCILLETDSTSGGLKRSLLIRGQDAGDGGSCHLSALCSPPQQLAGE